MPLIVHVGYHKTGSTAIQSFLTKNADALTKAHLILPPGLSPWLGHPEISWACGPNREPWHDRAYTRAEIAAHYAPYLEQSRSPGKTVLLTSEEFCRLEFNYASMRNLTTILEPYRPIIVGYTRSPLEFLLSRYRHEVQMGSERRPLRDYLCDFDNYFAAAFAWRTSVWDACFDQRTIFRQYDQVMKSSPNIIDHFMSLIGIDIAGLKVFEEDEEVKLHPALLQAARTVAESSIPDIDKQQLFDTLFALGDRLPDQKMRNVLAEMGLPREIEMMVASLSKGALNNTRTVASIIEVDRASAE